MNEQLYLESQVLLVVHLLASTRLDSSGGNENGWYSLEKLCREIHLDPIIVKRALSHGSINPTYSLSQRLHLPSPLVLLMNDSCKYTLHLERNICLLLSYSPFSIELCVRTNWERTDIGL